MSEVNETVVNTEVIEGQETQTAETIPEDIIDNPEIPEIDSENPEETEEGKEKETKEEDEEFDPNNMDFSEKDTTFGKYDLSKFQDKINFENTEAMEAFNKEAKKMEELGFTQEQVEYICEAVLGLNNEPEQPKKLTQKEVQADMKKNLTIEERNNYRVLNNLTHEALKGTELEANTKEIMSNPHMVKLINAIYKKASGNRVINNSNVPEQKGKAEYTLETVQKSYDEYMKKNPSKEEGNKFLSNLYKRIPEKDREQFEFIYEGLFTK